MGDLVEVKIFNPDWTVRQGNEGVRLGRALRGVCVWIAYDLATNLDSALVTQGSAAPMITIIPRRPCFGRQRWRRDLPGVLMLAGCMP